MHKIDWQHWQHLYVTAGKSLAELHQMGGPSMSSLKHRCARDRWASLRSTYLHQVSTKTQDQASTSIAVARARQAKLGQTIMDIVLKALTTLDPASLTPSDIARLGKVGAEIERKALGMESLRLSTDELSDEELERLLAISDQLTN
jgi:hypothetical protein